MAEKTTFIKLDRNILNWQWYQNPNTFRVFLHLLLKANVKKGCFEGVDIKRGELVTSYEKIGQQLNLTIQQVRTAISHLKSTGELTITRYSKFLVFTIVNYSQYQDKPAKLTDKSTINQQSINNQSTINQQQLKNIKNIKNKKNNISALSGQKNDEIILPATEEHCTIVGKNEYGVKSFDF